MDLLQVPFGGVELPLVVEGEAGFRTGGRVREGEGIPTTETGKRAGGMGGNKTLTALRLASSAFQHALQGASRLLLSLLHKPKGASFAVTARSVSGIGTKSTLTLR